MVWEGAELKLRQTINGEKAVNGGAQMVGKSGARDAARRRRCQLARRRRPIRCQSLKELLGHRTRSQLLPLPLRTSTHHVSPPLAVGHAHKKEAILLFFFSLPPPCTVNAASCH